MMDLLNTDWTYILSYLVKLGAAFLVALPIALDRERSTRLMGLRTFPLVAVASCGFVLVATEGAQISNQDAQARIIQGLMTGIGFVGGGAIIKHEGSVRGTATAVSIWTTGALGAAAAFGRYDIALIIGLLNFLVLRLLTPLKEIVDTEEREKEEEEA